MDSGSAAGSACDGDEGVSAAIGGSLETVRGAVKHGRRLLGLPFRGVIIGGGPRVGRGVGVGSDNTATLRGCSHPSAFCRLHEGRTIS